MNRFLISLLLAGIPGAGSAVFGADEAPLLRDTILDERAHHFPNETFEVVTVHGVTFQQEGVVTHDGWQYATFYDENGHVSVARRLLPGGEWEVLTLTDYAFNTIDSHNSVVLGICAEDGSIHLSFDHHNDPLKYRKSAAGAVDDPENTEWTTDLFGPIRDRLDGESVISALTYPRFIPTPEGDLLFTFRTGGSGGGDEVLYEYDGTAGEWTRLGEYIERSGSYSGSFTGSSTSRNAYPDNTVFDRNGRLHMTWCWRETPNARSNHDIQYAYSDDGGRTWKNNDGDEVASAGGNPITIDTPGIKVTDIPQNRNYINNSAMTVDPEGRVHVVAWHLPESEPDQDYNFTGSLASPSRYHHYWRDTGGTWHRNETDLTGTRAKLAADDDGYLYLAYGTTENIQIARATPGNGWSDWTEMDLTGALPEGRADAVNLVIDPFRWESDRVLSIYAQETNLGDSMEPTPLHVLDYGVSRPAGEPANGRADDKCSTRSQRTSDVEP